MSKRIKAWHFAPLNDKGQGYLRFDDGRIIKAGETYSCEGEPALCENGMHGSRSIIDALDYAPGAFISRVEIWGDVQTDVDKIVGRHRKILWCYDATDVLRRFARLCALDVVRLWNAPDVVVQYLKTGDESLRSAARSATWAARNAARDAAWDAAWAAVWDADRDAAWDAAWAARAAAWSAAWSAVWDADRDATWAASWAADRDEACGAARLNQRRRLTSMITGSRP